jgi:small membrane protein
MSQQIIALVIIIFFIVRLFWQKKKDLIVFNEFIFWLCFWLLSGTAIIFIKNIDKLLTDLGFSSSGINVLFYLAVILLFYLVFKSRIRLERIERDLTKIIREIALINKK